jgi:hypothetical protein
MVMAAIGLLLRPVGLLVEDNDVEGAEHASTVRSGVAAVVGP